MKEALHAIEPLIESRTYDEIIPFLEENFNMDLKTLDSQGRQLLWYVASNMWHHTESTDPCLSCIRYFLENGADVNHVDKFGKIALHIAAHRNSVHAVSLMLEFGAEIDLPDMYGLTPLFHALIQFDDRWPNAIATLINAGADPYKKTR